MDSQSFFITSGCRFIEVPSRALSLNRALKSRYHSPDGGRKNGANHAIETTPSPYAKRISHALAMVRIDLSAASLLEFHGAAKAQGKYLESVDARGKESTP